MIEHAPVPLIYIAGKYSALTREGERENVMAAARIALEVIKRGYAVFCPHTHSETINFLADGTLGYAQWMRVDLAILAQCDALLLLPGWDHSRGAIRECDCADALGMPIVKSIQALPEPAKFWEWERKWRRGA
jgi:hypothetical protein